MLAAAKYKIDSKIQYSHKDGVSYNILNSANNFASQKWL